MKESKDSGRQKRGTDEHGKEWKMLNEGEQKKQRGQGNGKGWKGGWQTVEMYRRYRGKL